MIINKIVSTNPLNLHFYEKRNQNISFGEKSIGGETIYNHSEEIDLKIKQVLTTLIATKRPVVLQDIASEINVNPDIVRRHILTNPGIKDLWKQVVRRKPAKQRTLAIIHPKNKPEDNNLIIKIKAFLENAIKTNKPISTTDFLPEIGITRNVFRDKINGNPELKTLWNECIHRKKTIDSIHKQEKLKNILQECADNNEYVDYHELSKRTGLTESACSRRIMRDEALLSLWAKIKTIQTEQKSESNGKIKDILSFYIRRRMVMDIDKIANEAGLDVRICKHKIEETSELFKLWQTGLHKRSKLPTQKESEAINNKIRDVLENANKNGISMRNEDIAKKAGIKAQICYGRLKRYPDLYALWKENNKLALNEYEKVNLKIKEEIEKAIAEKRTVSFPELSKITGFSSSLCSNRIYSSDELRTLWNEALKVSQDKILETIEKAILNAIKNNEKITYTILEKNYGITPDVLKPRLNENPRLKELWNKADHVGHKPEISKTQINVTKFQQSIINDKKIAEALQKAIDENKPVYQKEIAEEAGITQGACKERIRRVPKLKELWEKAEHKKLSDSSTDLNNKIQTILQNTKEKNSDISIFELAKITGISEKKCMSRLRRNENLNSLWNELKENREILIKQLSKLKTEGKQNSQIQKELGLSKETFNELMNKYENIKRMILSHSDKNISETEYLKWGVLTKREFELAVTKLFEKMGYKTGVTRYVIDGGIDVIAEKDGKKTFIECVHNLNKAIKSNEVLALQGCRYYYGADDIILVSSSGLFKGAKDAMTSINRNTDNKYKVMVLEDIIKTAKKYNLDIEDFNNIKNVNHKQSQDTERKQWRFKNIDTVTDEERAEWKNLSEQKFMHRIRQIFERQGYNISGIKSDIMKNGYLMEKNGEKSIIQYIPYTDRQIDAVRGLYGSKDVFKAKKVIMFGSDILTYASQNFISTVNKKYDKECIFKILSIDKIISLFRMLKH